MRRSIRCLLSVALALAFAASAVACSGGGGDPEPTGGGQATPSPPLEKKVVSALQDERYENGFTLRGLDSVTDSGIVKVINYGNETLEPVWGLAQWWSKYNLKDGKEINTADQYALSDASKTLEYNKKTAALTLGLDGSKEFDSYNIAPPSKWPHLLLEQSLKDDMWLKDAERVEVSLDFTLTRGENLRGGNAGLHAQFAWFIYVVDSNPESPGYGNFLWFGLNIYDSTKIYAAATAQQDTAGGPGNFIYTLGGTEFLSDRVRVGQNNKFRVDVLPHIAKAIETAQSRGFMSGTKLDDCRLTGMNIGWEVFDRWDVSVTLFDMGIDLTLKEDNTL